VSIGPRHDVRAHNRGLSKFAFAGAGRCSRAARIGEPCRLENSLHRKRRFSRTSFVSAKK
jgi:hypothetical protein